MSFTYKKAGYRFFAVAIVFVHLFSLSTTYVWAQVQEETAPVKEMSAKKSFGYIKPTDALLTKKWFVMDQEARQLLDKGSLLEAEKIWIEAAGLAEANSDIEPGMVNCLVGLSLLYHKKGDPKESERVYEYAMRNMEGLVGRQSIRFARYLPDLGWLYHEHGRHDQAEILFKQHLDMHEKEYGQYSSDIVDSLDHYSKFLRKVGRSSEATSLETRIKSIQDRQVP